MWLILFFVFLLCFSSFSSFEITSEISIDKECSSILFSPHIPSSVSQWNSREDLEDSKKREDQERERERERQIERERNNSTYVLTILSSKKEEIQNTIQLIKQLHDLTLFPISILILQTIENYSIILIKLQKLLMIYSQLHIFPMNEILFNQSIHNNHFKKKKKKERNEFFILNIFLLPYQKILYLNSKLTLLKPIDHLFSCPYDLLYTNQIEQVFDQNIFLVRINTPVIHHLVSTFSTLPSHVTLQSFLAETFFSVSSSRWRFRIARISSCLYNYQQFERSLCSVEYFQQYFPNSSRYSRGTGVSPYVISIWSNWLKEELRFILHPPELISTPSPKPKHISSPFRSSRIPSTQSISNPSKPCLCDFWIIGARKSGTTALYTWLTEHPSILPLNLKNLPNDGEIMIPIHIDNLPRYNEVFHEGFEHILPKQGGIIIDKYWLGDSWVGRFANHDYRAISSICKHKYLKIMILLRDPIERCVSQMHMRYRREMISNQTKLNKLTTFGSDILPYNLTKSIENELKAYNTNSFRKDTGKFYDQFPSTLIPPTLKDWKGNENCIYEGLYSVHLTRWLVALGADNIRVYFTRDFESATSKVLLDAFNFLRLPNSTQWRYDPHRHTKKNAPNRDHMNLSTIIPERLEEQLKEIFAPFNRRLEQLLNIDSTPWGY